MCKSGCHGCPALLRRTGPLAPHDNHSLVEGHRFGPTLASNLLLCCWSAHKSLAPRARTLLGVLGHATLNFVAVVTLLFCFFCECPKFCDLAKQRRKMFLRVSEVGKIDFALYFCWLCVFFVIFYILLLRSRDVLGSSRVRIMLYPLLAQLQDSFTETRDEQCACCIRDEHTCGLYLSH